MINYIFWIQKKVAKKNQLVFVYLFVPFFLSSCLYSFNYSKLNHDSMTGEDTENCSPDINLAWKLKSGSIEKMSDPNVYKITLGIVIPCGEIDAKGLSKMFAIALYTKQSELPQDLFAPTNERAGSYVGEVDTGVSVQFEFSSKNRNELFAPISKAGYFSYEMGYTSMPGAVGPVNPASGCLNMFRNGADHSDKTVFADLYDTPYFHPFKTMFKMVNGVTREVPAPLYLDEAGSPGQLFSSTGPSDVSDVSSSLVGEGKMPISSAPCFSIGNVRGKTMRPNLSPLSEGEPAFFVFYLHLATPSERRDDSLSGISYKSTNSFYFTVGKLVPNFMSGKMEQVFSPNSTGTLEECVSGQSPSTCVVNKI